MESDGVIHLVQSDRVDANPYGIETDGCMASSESAQYLRTPSAPDAEVYSMNGPKRGKVLIFNPHRSSIDRDIVRLMQVLPLLGFQPEDIKVLQNLNSSEISQAVKNLKNDDDLNNCDCLVMVILTHEQKSTKWMAQGNEHKFFDHFTPRTLQSMAGKPKLFIIQACPTEQLNAQPDRTSNDQIDSQVQEFSYPEFADFLMVRSSPRRGMMSSAGQQSEPLLIQELCKVIESCDPKESSICEILTDTIGAVAERDQGQVSSFYSTLTKKLYFY